ncbi:MAG: rod shape-determining protein MreC [Candidatus Aminicenantes bacterium]
MGKCVFAVFTPIQNAIWSGYYFIDKTWNDYIFFRDVSRRNEALNRKVFNLRQENRMLKNLLLHYKKDKKVREILEGLSQTIMSARVIGFDMGNIYSSVVINRGTIHGVKPDMIVLDRFGNLIGRVIEPVSLFQSRVQLITDTESGVSVRKKDGESLGIISGDAGGMCRLKYILSTDTTIMPGDVLITTGFDGIYPPDLEVGKVDSVKKSQDLFRSIKVQPMFKFKDLDIVGIITMDINDAY